KVRDRLALAATGFGRISTNIKAFAIRHENVVKSIIKPGFHAYLEAKKRQVGVTNGDRVRIEGLLADDEILKDLDDDKNLLVPEVREYRESFLNKYFGTEEGFKELQDVLGQEALDEIDKIIEGDIDPFMKLDAAAASVVENIRRAPQFSVSFFTKQRGLGADEYRGEAIYDYGLANRTNLTLNAGFLYTDSKFIGGDTRGGRAAGQLRFQLTPE